jgi:hypothetical protein
MSVVYYIYWKRRVSPSRVIARPAKARLYEKNIELDFFGTVARVGLIFCSSHRR